MSLNWQPRTDGFEGEWAELEGGAQAHVSCLPGSGGPFTAYMMRRDGICDHLGADFADTEAGKAACQEAADSGRYQP